MSITEQRFNGWRRLPRGRWKCVVFNAASDREALERLRELTAGEMFVDLCVLGEGRHPSDQLGGPSQSAGGRLQPRGRPPGQEPPPAGRKGG